MSDNTAKMQHKLEKVSETFCFGGRLQTYRHTSKVNHCDMQFAVYLPPQYKQATKSEPLPVLYWLSGLTCTEENFIAKAGAQQYAAKHGIIVIAPDTSPRGEGVPDDPDCSWDFGLGAGFYLDATEQPWAKHYNMYSYVACELPQLLVEHFHIDSTRQAISGHSMGGHGALSIALKNPQTYVSASAFAPIVAPSKVPWGHKAFGLYLGNSNSGNDSSNESQQKWLNYDSCHLIANPTNTTARQVPLLVSQGLADNFLDQQLQPQRLVDAAAKHNHPLVLEQHENYDHSYYFIASFIEQHFDFHAKYLLKEQ